MALMIPVVTHAAPAAKRGMPAPKEISADIAAQAIPSPERKPDRPLYVFAGCDFRIYVGAQPDHAP